MLRYELGLACPRPALSLFCALQLSLGGVQLWRYKTLGILLSQPTVAADDTVYFGDDMRYIYALAGGDGTRKWGTRLTGLIVASPAIGSDATVFIGSADSQ